MGSLVKESEEESPVNVSSPSPGEGDKGDDDMSTCENLCYQPVTSFEELMNYGEGERECGLVRDVCRKKTVPLLEDNFSAAKFKISGNGNGGNNKGAVVDNSAVGKRPLTMVCHDLKGGYGDDRFVNGCTNMENYTYRHWLLTDIFVYFSHKFVTIPPLGWINAAHSHGVKILGTIITEWDDGLAICKKILATEQSINETVEKLAKINEDYGFDGYLLNIENKLEDVTQVKQMVEFTRKLTEALKSQSKKNLVIWYDSVTKEGELKWQDELNDKNKIFFDACDGIYLNYNWNEDKLRNSVNIAGNRRYDVFAGIDCWGRGCWGGGGLNTCLAVDKISPHDISYAFFAPGWTYESHDFQKYPFIDDELWTKCMKNLYFRGLTKSHLPLVGTRISTNGSVSPDAKSGICDNASNSFNNNDKSTTSTKKFQIFFGTDFSRGYGQKRFSFGKVISETPWYDLSKQSFQPVIFSSQKCLEYNCSDQQAKLTKLAESKKKQKQEDKQPEKPSSVLMGEESKIFYDTTNGFSGGGCLKLLNSKKQKDFEDPMTSSPIWIPMNIPITDSRLTLATIAIWKSTSIHHQLKIFLELGQDGCPTRKILLGSLDSLATSIRGKFCISFRLGQFLECINSEEKLSSAPSTPGSSSPENKNDLQFYFQKNNYDEKELNGWRVSCFLFDIDQVYDKYSSIKSLRVGAEGEISLGFLSLGQITHYHQ